ncbi:glycoside hydrolase family 9 protein [Actinoplanes sp. LDG1-06]|uniref:Glycoside hydrolase family 9 protein n=1 Tax=Paractinoplanes ovalisporus TaxID=2810368 RepID=A0ABS2AR61_9ACTN|nr:glycoside hydrolase family 9 protein [Actinoplanes ovalisporus]MBM2622367.1 glycoside hydrolase family 9 protein [Actinoplanes ovalisporus]
MTRSARRVLGILLSATLLAGADVACDRALAPDALIRVDQVGYAPGETKIAYLLSPRDASEVRVTVLNAYGKPVLNVQAGTNRGPWNAGFPDVRPIDLSGLKQQGVYRVRVEGSVRAESPPFLVEPAAELFGPAARDALSYFQNHRDGADQVPSQWQRKPAHLADRAATVYERPSFDAAGRLTADLSPVDGPVDVEGGWYDAGDFLKFTHTTAYALSAMLLARRDGLISDGLAAETAHGLTWLDKMWDADKQVLYTQVGIGSGSTDGGFLGDHDTWRLPETDDQLDVRPGDKRYFQRYRPVFRAAGPGEPISPNLAGRVAAAFALAAQVEAREQPDRARAHLDAAAGVFDLARTENVGELVTAEPRSFYPEDRWTDDLAFGATELALAGRALGDPRTREWTATASEWARRNAGRGGNDALSVYDVSALADAEAIRLLGGGRELLPDMRRRLDAGMRTAAGNPMGAAAGNGGYDYAARQLGYAATAELYEHVSGDERYAAFATAQRGVVLGVNGWGTSMVVGAGTTYPRCPHDQIATLTRTAESGLSMTGAVVNGPNRADRVHELQATSGPATCRNDRFAAFDRDDVHFADDSRISANTEPSIDFSATGLLAFALMARQH